MTDKRSVEEIARKCYPFDAIEGSVEMGDFLREQICLALRAERDEADRLRECVREALALSDEGWSYAGDYFPKKWGRDAQTADIRSRAGLDKEDK